MGSYDTVRVYCPKCGRRHELQSKSGDCLGLVFNLGEAPPCILASIDGEVVTCKCETRYKVKLVTMATVVPCVEEPEDDDDEWKAE